MSKHITISDEVYRELKREKGDRSFSDVICDHLEERRQLVDVTGAGTLDRETHGAVKEDLGELSRGTLSNLDDKILWYIGSRRYRPR